MANSKTEVVRLLNDELRVAAKGSGRVCVSSGIAALGTNFAAEVLAAVRSFTDFNGDNDPHGEHDGAMMQVGQDTIFWKIDYYDPTLTRHSSDPSDPAVTQRVMTIMLAEEY